MDGNRYLSQPGLAETVCRAPCTFPKTGATIKVYLAGAERASEYLIDNSRSWIEPVTGSDRGQIRGRYKEDTGRIRGSIEEDQERPFTACSSSLP